ncbi:hypothetical protein D9619_003660 [Psilocybe cf. subviscida]|uniref:Protein kinase domain-containing protein n=1 Tax=Psilocybe cf. subviscida TaxID=2480587 RepID=A0A8H5AW13_9AGAR|nr:hypothetical protein D9619_003660 [Psilocybe cf. subviscida]
MVSSKSCSTSGLQGIPSDATDSEMTQSADIRTSSLTDVVRAIWEYASNIPKRRTQYRFELISDCKGHQDAFPPAPFMDAYIYDPAENDIMVPVVTEKLVEEKAKMNQQVMNVCTRLMNDDPRRVFMYAVTAEGTQMTIWYFSRSHSVRTASFDWSGDDVVKLIRVILVFAFASPEELGFDPRVHKSLRNSQDESQQFVYEYVTANSAVELELSPDFTLASSGTLPNSEFACTSALRTQRTCNIDKIYYKTIKLLGMPPPFIITGRTTRVWLVKEVSSSTGDIEVHDTEPMVLKDVWLRTDSPTEVENLEAMFHAVDSFVQDGLERYSHAGPDALDLFLAEEPKFKCFDKASRDRLKHFLTAKNYRTLFLTTLRAWKGRMSKALSNYARRPDGLVKAMDETKTSSKSVVKGMRQHRFVYKEVCTPCHELPTFGDAMDVLRQSLDALCILYCAAWVHRDISSGNILAMGPYIENGQKRYQVKLSDFEFAQPMNRDNHRPDLRTGTTQYMPVEIMGRKYILENIRKPLDAVNTSNGQALDQVDPLLAALVNKRVRKINKPMFHWGITPEHPLFVKLGVFKECPNLLPIPDNATLDIPDCDAIVNYNYQHDLESIWWIILYFVTSLANHEPSKNYAMRWFLDDATTRNQCLTSVIDTHQFTIVLKPEFQQVFPVIIEILRDALHTEYIARAVYGLLMDDSSYAFIHALFAQVFDNVLESANITNWAQVQVDNSCVKGPKS